MKLASAFIALPSVEKQRGAFFPRREGLIIIEKLWNDYVAVYESHVGLTEGYLYSNHPFHKHLDKPHTTPPMFRESYSPNLERANQIQSSQNTSQCDID